MKKFAIIMILFSCAFANAQEAEAPKDSLDIPWTFQGAEKRLKFSPFDIFSVIPTLGADLEVNYKNGISFQAGVGAILPNFQYLSGSAFESFDKLGGYKLRGESRFYVFKKPTRYFASEFSFRHLIIQDEMGIGMEPFTSTDEWGWEDTDYAYFVKTDMRFHRFNTQLNLKYGFQKTWENGFCLDFYTGLSIRTTKVRTWSEIPEGGELPRTWNDINWTLEDGFKRSYFTPIVGLKLGFVL